jgi:hypothetical protein
MAIYDDKWFEFWYSEGDVLPNYFLIVSPDKNEKGKIIVIDPLKNNEIVFRGKDYEEVSDWLIEDEFHIVNGRMFDDDGW